MEFRILGPLEVLDGGRPLTIRRGKEAALLAYLLLHANEVVPSGRLIDELWDERPPTTAPKILHNAVSHLRKQLGDGRIRTSGPGYLLHVEEDELDLHAFERLAEDNRPEDALALWRGPPLLDLEEERFAEDARRQLEEKRLAVLEGRIAGDLAEGRHLELIAELEALVAVHPLRERFSELLMLALYRAGRQGDALAVYRRARTTLGEELGLEPGPPLQELERKILKQEADLAAPPRQMRTPARTGSDRRRPRRLAMGSAVGVLAVAALVLALIYALNDSSKPPVVKPNSLVAIDPTRNRVVDVVPIGETPRGVTTGARYVWTANPGDGTVSQIDPKNLHTRTVGLGAAATALVEQDGVVWVVTGNDNSVVPIDARSGGVLNVGIRISDNPSASAYTIAAAPAGIWIGSGSDLVKLDPSTQRLGPRWHYKAGISDVALTDNAVWLVSRAKTVAKVSPSTGRLGGETTVSMIPAALAISGGSVWVATGAPYDNRAAVWRVDPLITRVTQTTPLGGALGLPPYTLDVASGAGAIWVAVYDTGTVARIDPRTGTVVKLIRIGGHPSGIAVGLNRVWVTVS
jgi:DNA-binding SARP family transcriptional activator